MSKHDFFHSTPNDIEIFIDQFLKRRKWEMDVYFERMRYTAWLNGLYVQNAVASVLSKRATYPKEPYGNSKEVTIEATEDMSEEEKDFARKALLQNLLGMQEEFNQSHNVESKE